MAFITFYGQPTSDYQYIKSNVLKELLDKGHKCAYREVQDIDQIMHNCAKIPSVSLNGVMQIEYPGTGVQSYVQKVSHLIDHTIRKMINHLIVPIDYSNTSENTVQLALKLAKQHNFKITFLHVYYPDAATAELGIQLADQFEQTQRERFNNWFAKLNETSDTDDLTLDRLFSIGFPAQVICQFSNMLSNAVIVMARNNDAQLLKKVLGSVSMYVMKHATIPVMLVPPMFSKSTLKKACLAYDAFEPDSQEINEMFSFVTQANLDLDLLHIKKSDAQNNNINELGRKAAAIIHKDRLTIFQKIHNSVESGILEHIENNQIDLLIMLKTQKNFIQKWINKSHTKSILSKLDIPILVYHEYA